MPKPIPTETDLLAVAAARQAAGGVDTCTLWRWAQAGIIPKPIKINRRNYWVRGEFEAALRARAKAEATQIAPGEIGGTGHA